MWLLVKVHRLYVKFLLDHCCFESAHLKYAMLRAKSRYPQLCSDPVSMATDVKLMDSLRLFTPA